VTFHCPPVSSRRRGPTRPEAGFSLVELLATIVVMLVVLGIVTQVVIRSQVVYGQQREHLERRYSTATTIEMMLRLLRQAQDIDVDPDGNGVLDSIRIRADWNPRDGDFEAVPETVPVDAYEDITFTRNGTTIFKWEPDFDADPVAFTDNINQLVFEYFNPAGGAVPNPLTSSDNQLAFVRVTVGTTPVDGQPGVVITSSASVRRLE
jgi:prepilin-type N-terminal cleavage/methylation domain-containing protein